MTLALLVVYCVLMVLGTKLTAKAINNFVLATSLPEFFVVLAAVFTGRAEVSLSNLLGANVTDLSLIIGGVTLMMGTVPVVGEYWRWELAATFLAGTAPILLMMDGNLSRIDGLILLTIYLIYIEGLVVNNRRKSLSEGIPLFEFVLGITMLALSAYGLVMISDKFGVNRLSPIIFGLIIISLATTLSGYLEVFLGVSKKNFALILSNLLGSVVTNATLLIGLLALLRPIKVPTVTIFPVTNLAFVVVFGLFWMFTATKRKLERWEGLVLVGVFVTFVGLVLLSSSI